LNDKHEKQHIGNTYLCNSSDSITVTRCGEQFPERLSVVPRVAPRHVQYPVCMQLSIGTIKFDSSHKVTYAISHHNIKQLLIS